MPAAKKLPSGNYRCQLYVGKDEDGKRLYKSFTAKTKKEAERLAYEYEVEHDTRNKSMKLSKAFDEYCSARSNLLAPNTIISYNTAKKNVISVMGDVDIYTITPNDIQKATNEMYNSFKNGSVKTYISRLLVVLEYFREDFEPKVKLKSKDIEEVDIPTQEEVNIMLEYSKKNNQRLYRAILLAIYATMREGEICALTSDDIVGNEIIINKAMSNMVEGGSQKAKEPKTKASVRRVSVPNFVIDELQGINGRLVDMRTTSVYCAFVDMLGKCNLPHYKFHALRHYSASLLHAMGIPEKYIMERGGWSSNHTLNMVYRHTMKDVKDEINDKINANFESMQHGCNTKRKRM